MPAGRPVEERDRDRAGERSLSALPSMSDERYPLAKKLAMRQRIEASAELVVENNSSVAICENQLVVRSWGAWGMQWMEGKTVRHTVTRRNGGCCTRLLTRAGNGVALCQAVKARRLPLNRRRPCGKGCRCVWRKRRQLGRELPCHGLGSDRHLR